MKTLVDIDEECLAAAQKLLNTKTKKDTVNEALRSVIAQAARAADLQRFRNGGLPDLLDDSFMTSAWRR